MNFSLVIVFGLLLVAGGCSRPEDRSPVVIEVGVPDNGYPFFESTEMMTYKTVSERSAHWSNGSHVHASFRRPTWKASLEIDLLVKVSDDGRYSVDGTLTSLVPIHLELLGTAPTEKEADSILSFPAGTSHVRFDGKLFRHVQKKARSVTTANGGKPP